MTKWLAKSKVELQNKTEYWQKVLWCEVIFTLHNVGQLLKRF